LQESLEAQSPQRRSLIRFMEQKNNYSVVSVPGGECYQVAYHLVERSYGNFARCIQLPTEVRSNKINASYKNGILKVTLPKSEEAKLKEIKIKVK
jgi:HSP20 family molecular chaperone IbpA